MAHVGRLRQELSALSEDDDMITQLHNGTNYECPECGKAYIRQGWFRLHLSESHKWVFAKTESSQVPEVKPFQCLLQMGLLLRDTYDAYSMCDGNRIFRNASFEWLFASAAQHYKYRLWLWRMLSYDKAILSEREAFEYRWNTCVNTKGGDGKNIPNDNLVELHVGKIKKQLMTQGANKSFNSAKTIAMTTQALDATTVAMNRSCKLVRSSGRRPDTDRTADILEIVKCIRASAKELKDLEWKAFSKFKHPLSKVNSVNLHNWIQEQKKIAKLLMEKL